MAHEYGKAMQFESMTLSVHTGLLIDTSVRNIHMVNNFQSGIDNVLRAAELAIRNEKSLGSSSINLHTLSNSSQLLI